MTIENQKDLDGVLRTGHVVAVVLNKMLEAMEPGMTTAELDGIGERLLNHYGAQSAPRITYNFPAATCISINEQAAHGVPGSRVIQAGDVVNIDVSARLNGYFADTGGTRVVPPSSPVKTRLCHATRLALKQALRQVRAGTPINRIGKAVQQVAKKHKFKIIKNLAGHGTGRNLHEEPKEIVGFYDPGDKRVLQEGQVIAIEPFLSTKSSWANEDADGWTLITEQTNLSAQYEHTVIVTRNNPIIATRC